MANSTRKRAPRGAKPAAVPASNPAPDPAPAMTSAPPPSRRSPWRTAAIVVGALAVLAVVFGAGGVIGYGYGRVGGVLRLRFFTRPFTFRMQPYGGMMQPYGGRLPNDDYGWMPHRRLGPLAAGPAYLGVTYGEVDPSRAKQEGLSAGEGAEISQVIDGSPAAKAGIQAGDIILAVDGQRLTQATLLRLLIHGHVPGDQAELLVLHDGQQSTITVTLGEQPGQPAQ